MLGLIRSEMDKHPGEHMCSVQITWSDSNKVNEQRVLWVPQNEDQKTTLRHVQKEIVIQWKICKEAQALYYVGEPDAYKVHMPRCPCKCHPGLHITTLEKMTAFRSPQPLFCFSLFVDCSKLVNEKADAFFKAWLQQK